MYILVLEPGYFANPKQYAASLLADRIILADHIRYRKKSIFNRTRIRNSTASQWLSIPLLPKMRKNPIFRVKTEDVADWGTNHKRGLDYNYRTSPYYEHFEDRISEFFALDKKNLGDWTFESMLLSQNLLGINTPIIRASQLLKDSTNMEGLIKFLESDLDAGSKILSHEEDWWIDFIDPAVRSSYSWKEEPYHQNFEGFVSGMSILDLIFNHGPSALAYLKRSTALI